MVAQLQGAATWRILMHDTRSIAWLFCKFLYYTFSRSVAKTSITNKPSYTELSNYFSMKEFRENLQEWSSQLENFRTKPYLKTEPVVSERQTF